MRTEPGRNGTIGGPTRSSWREGALTRVAELEVLALWFRRGEERDVIADGIHRHIAAAREAAEGRPPRSRWARLTALVAGSPHERAASNIDAAEVDLLRVADDAFLRGQIPSLLAQVRAHLRVDDPRRCRVEEIAVAAMTRALDETERNTLVAAVRAANSEARREVMRVRSFRNVLYLATALMTLAAVGLTVLGFARPDVVPVCFTPTLPDKVVCPTSETSLSSISEADVVVRQMANGWDVFTVEILGLIAAAVAAAIALRGIRGTTTPYSLPVALALLKLPTGALTAVLGLLLMRGGFVPGLSALDTPAQILSWAIIFGYAQQLFTRFVDQQAHSVLDQVGAPRSDDRRAGASAAYALASVGPGGSDGAGPSANGAHDAPRPAAPTA